MRYLLLAMLAYALAVPAFAKVIEIPYSTSDAGVLSSIGRLLPVFGGKGEQELSWDDGTEIGPYSNSSGSINATTFTAPAACYLLEYRIFWANGGNADIDWGLYADDGGGIPHKPTGNALFSIISNSGSTHHDWLGVDVSGESITFSNGEIFHPSWDFSTADCGCYLDTAVTGSYSRWLSGPAWTDHSASYTFMMRVVVNDDMDGPYAADQDPADGATGVAVDADILFDIQDDDMGVDATTITTDSVIVTDDTKTVISGTITVDDSDPNDVHVTFDPDGNFALGVTVTVTVSPSGDEITDDLGNVMAEESWSFGVIYTGIESASLGEIKANFK